MPTEQAGIGDNHTDTFRTNYPYLPGSLRVTVNGIAVIVTELDPTAGTFRTG